MLDDLILINTFEKVIKFEIKKQFFFRGWHFCHLFGTLRVNIMQIKIIIIREGHCG